ncbi:DUF1542 domain-containing protein [Fructobacillus parabroussonetiae]|uniref:DUF1542 domain-containing protein n=1 Tax=Fructobacillus parabroussonetiae TaxID=2713174 RepID=A0ABS5QX67_9LACO|nr:DUF1542 domain-containing protein [Fructobacillus parabroussonetiae]MBS9337397.1 DUF1542 domain-containing protein [Fructobacillus parabroussonetiae]
MSNLLTYEQKAKTKGLTIIQNVAEPSRQADYEAATVLERTQAKQAIEQARSTKEKDFSAIEHVDADSLSQQLTTLQALADEANREIDGAQTKGELQTALKHGLAMLDTVAKPELALAYQEVNAISRQNAYDAINASSKTKAVSMAKVPHVDSQSLADQQALLVAIVNETNERIDQSNNMAALRDILTKGLAAVDSLADPVKEAAYRRPAVADQEAAKKSLADAVPDKKKAFAGIDGVDPNGLDQSDKDLDKALEDALKVILEAKTAADLEKSFRDGLKKINQVPEPAVIEAKQEASAADHQRADDKVRHVISEKQDDFAKIDHVDEQSLEHQEKALDSLLKKTLAGLGQAVTKEDLAKALQEALDAIQSVAAPKLEKGYRPASDEDRDNARIALETASREKQDAMATIDHVDQQSLADQRRVLDQLLADLLSKLAEATLQKDVQSILNDGRDAIHDVANPTVENAYQSANEAKKQSAIDTLRQAIDAKKKTFETIEHVDQASLNKQENFLNTLLAEGQSAIEKAQENGEVDQVIQNILSVIAKVARPTLEADYQPASTLMKDLAKKALSAEAKAQEEHFKGIAHVNQEELTQQLTKLTNTLADQVQAVETATTRGQVKQAVQEGLVAIDAIDEPGVEVDYQAVTDRDRQKAHELVNRAHDHKTKDFAGIDHVDSDSLEAQEALLDKAAEAANRAIDAATIQSELKQATDDALKNLAAVAAPEVSPAYQPVAPDSVATAKEALDQAAEAKKKAFDSIDDLDPQSKKRQFDALDKAVEKGKKAIDAATNRGEMAKAFHDALAAVDDVATPDLQEEKQAANDQDRQKAKQKLAQQAETRKQVFAAIEHVDPTSLQNQQGLVDQALVKGQNAIDQAQTKGEVEKALQLSLNKLNQISSPSLESAYQKADQA